MDTCYGALGDARSLVDDEAESHKYGPYSAFNTRALCQCDGKMLAGLEAAWPAPTDLEPKAYGERKAVHGAVPGFCFCRSLARTTRVVVGPDFDPEQPEKDMERPAFLNYTGALDGFPFCRCRGTEPCLTRRICRRGLLGNTNHPLGNLAGEYDDNADLDTDATRRTTVDRMFVTRQAMYAKWELDRLETCSGQNSKASPLCTIKTEFGSGVVAATPTQPDANNVVLGYRTQDIALNGGLSCNRNDHSNTYQLFTQLWRSSADCTLDFQLVGSVCVPTSSCATLGPGFAELFPDLELTLVNNRLAMPVQKYTGSFDRDLTARLANCLLFSSMNADATDIEDVQEICRGGKGPDKVVVYLPSTVESAPAIRANGVCLGVDQQTQVGEVAAVAQMPTGQYAATFEKTLCANFRGVFETLDAEQRVVASEVCFGSDAAGGCSDGLLKIGLSTDFNSCTSKKPLLLNAGQKQTAEGQYTFGITVRESTSASIVLTKFEGDNVCNAGSTAGYDVMYVLKTGADALRILIGSDETPILLDANSVYHFRSVRQGFTETVAYNVKVDDPDSTLQVMACVDVVRDLSEVSEAAFLFGECDTRSVFAANFLDTGPVTVQTYDLGKAGRTVGIANVPLPASSAGVLAYVVGMVASQDEKTVHELVPAACRVDAKIHVRKHQLNQRGTFEFVAGRCRDLFFCGGDGEAWVVERGSVAAGVDDDTGEAVPLAWQAVGQVSFKECRLACPPCTADGCSQCHALSWTPRADTTVPLVGTCSKLMGVQPTLVRGGPGPDVEPTPLLPEFTPEQPVLVLCPAAVPTEDAAAEASETSVCAPGEVKATRSDGGVECIRTQCPDGTFSQEIKTSVRLPTEHCQRHESGISAVGTLEKLQSASSVISTFDATELDAVIPGADDAVQIFYKVDVVEALAQLPTYGTVAAKLARLEVYKPWLETPPDGCVENQPDKFTGTPNIEPYFTSYVVRGIIEVEISVGSQAATVFFGDYTDEETLVIERDGLAAADGILTGAAEATIIVSVTGRRVEWFNPNAQPPAFEVKQTGRIYLWPALIRSTVEDYDGLQGCRDYNEVYEGEPVAATLEWCFPGDPTGHGCTAITVCDPLTHYEKTPPAADRDRECVALTTCAADTHFESRAPTPTTDRGCSARAECNTAISFYKDGGSGKSQTVCQARGECTRGQEYHGNTESALADTECLTYTVCGDDQYEGAPGTAATDRTCVSVSEQCEAGTFEQAAPTATTDRSCFPVRACVEGETEGTSPTAGTDRVCVPIEPPAPPPETKNDLLLEDWAAWTFAGGGILVLVATRLF